jgi:hypothetical protein
MAGEQNSTNIICSQIIGRSNDKSDAFSNRAGPSIKLARRGKKEGFPRPPREVTSSSAPRSHLSPSPSLVHLPVRALPDLLQFLVQVHRNPRRGRRGRGDEWGASERAGKVGPTYRHRVSERLSRDDRGSFDLDPTVEDGATD